MRQTKYMSVLVKKLHRNEGFALLYFFSPHNECCISTETWTFNMNKTVLESVQMRKKTKKMRKISWFLPFFICCVGCFVKHSTIQIPPRNVVVIVSFSSAGDKQDKFSLHFHPSWKMQCNLLNVVWSSPSFLYGQCFARFQPWCWLLSVRNT